MDNELLLSPAKRFALLLGLLAANVIWACNPVMAKYVLLETAPVEAAWLRITASFLVLALAYPLLMRSGVHLPVTTHRFPWKRAGAIGGITFFITPLLVYTGVNGSTATHNSFITGLEPVITIVLARVVLRERIRPEGWLTLIVAMAGFVLLSGIINQAMGIVAGPYIVGNVLLLAAMAGEAAFSIIGGPLTRRASPVAILLAALATGTGLLGLYLVTTGAFPNVTALSGRVWLGITWSGPLSTAGCCLFWLMALRHLPVNAAAFSLFIQPLLGAALGYGLLAERLDPIAFAGAVLILIALAIYAGHTMWKPASTPMPEPENAPAISG